MRHRISCLIALLLTASWACTGAIDGGRGGSNDDDGENDDAPPDGDGGSGGRGGRPGGSGGGGAGGGADAVVPTTLFARLSHRQWENTVRDLLKLSAAPGLAASFTGDAVRGKFDNGGGTLQVTAGLWADYERAAESLAEKATTDAAALARLVGTDLPADPTARARAFVERFGQRAFRRPLTKEETDRYATFFAKGASLYGSGDAWKDGVRLVVEAMLQSPHFLYRTELGAGGDRIALDGWEIASKLSYTLVNSMPDDALFTAAMQKKLGTRDEVLAHAKRLFDSDAGKATLDDFHHQLLRLKVYDGIDKDRTKFPAFVPGIGADMRQETLLFVRDVVFGGAGGTLHDLLTSPKTFVNKRTAPLYGLTGTFDDTMKSVSLDPTQRAGLLTHLGFLASNAHRDEIDSIHRGVFVHLAVLCTNLPPPADNVPPVPAGGGKTNRERVTAHTGPGTCGAACHGDIINPVGFAFEAYDALGRYRTTDGGERVDASGKLDLESGTIAWTDAVEFSQRVAESPEAHGCYTRALLEYLHGRQPTDDDLNLVGRVSASSQDGRAPVKELVFELVASDTFRFRTP